MGCDRRQIFESLYFPLPHVPIIKEKTALIITDMQYFDAERGYGVFAKAKELGLDHLLDYYYDRLRDVVIPNIQSLLDAFRSQELEVIYSKIESLTRDGRDRSKSHKLMEIHSHKNSKEAEIIEELKPKNDEIVISKSASGVFGTTNIDYILKNLGIESLIVTGVLTNECVENCVRAAADLGYIVVLPEDATAALTPELQEASLKTLGHTYAQVKKTKEVLNAL